jgi:hypothetical protein
MPKKPTTSFGTLIFSKDGRVTKKIRRLSDVKIDQELGVATSFLEGFNRHYALGEMASLIALSESDHDFSVTVDGRPVYLQVTEMVDRGYTKNISSQDHEAGRFKNVAYIEPGVPVEIDHEKQSRALWEAISKKIAKCYSRPKTAELWLLVFGVGIHYPTEYYENGVLCSSEGLKIARLNSSVSVGPFAQVWYTNLISRPCQIYPDPSQGVGGGAA